MSAYTYRCHLCGERKDAGTAPAGTGRHLLPEGWTQITVSNGLVTNMVLCGQCATPLKEMLRV